MGPEGDPDVKTILCDMDGVLSWFGMAAARACGRPDRDGSHPETYHMEADWGLSAKDFWAKIDSKGEVFWSYMLPCPWAEDVWTLCKKYADRVVILTSPPRAPHAWAGKVAWLQRMFGVEFRDMALVPAGHKNLLAKKNTLLLDDHEENCDRFIAAGGDALLWPASYNRNRGIQEPLAWLERNLALFSRL